MLNQMSRRSYRCNIVRRYNYEVHTSTSANTTAFRSLGTPAKEIANHRADGWVVIEALADHSDPAAEARRLGCSHVIQNREIKNV